MVAPDVPEEDGEYRKQALVECTKFSCSSAKLIIEQGSNQESYVVLYGDHNFFRAANRIHTAGWCTGSGMAAESSAGGGKPLLHCPLIPLSGSIWDLHLPVAIINQDRLSSAFRMNVWSSGAELAKLS